VDTLTVHTLAEVLKEPNKELLGRVLRRLGQERCSQVLTDALALEGFAIVIAQKWSLSNLRDTGWTPCPCLTSPLTT
jgi:hypothetical protein